MGWEMRGSSGPYYYAKERRGGRVVSTYLGRGEGAQAIADCIEYRRRRDDLDRRDRQGTIEQAEQTTAAARALLHDLDRLAGAAMRAALTDAGYHQHDRGEWRRRRGDGGRNTPAA